MFGGSLGKLREVIWPVQFVVRVMSCLVNLSSLSCLPHSTTNIVVQRITRINELINSQDGNPCIFSGNIEVVQRITRINELINSQDENPCIFSGNIELIGSCLDLSLHLSINSFIPVIRCTTYSNSLYYIQ